MYCFPQLDSILYVAELNPTSDWYYPSLPAPFCTSVISVYSMSKLSQKVRCVIIHLCLCDAYSCEFDVTSSYDDSRGVPYGSGEKSSPVASIRRCVWGLLI